MNSFMNTYIYVRILYALHGVVGLVSFKKSVQ